MPTPPETPSTLARRPPPSGARTRRIARRPLLSMAEALAAAEPIVGRAVLRKMHLFRYYRDVDRADLVQHALVAVLAGAGSYDPARGSWSTYVYTIATRAVLGCYRRRSTLARWEGFGARRQRDLVTLPAFGCRRHHEEDGAMPTGEDGKPLRIDSPERAARWAAFVGRCMETGRRLFGSGARRVGRRYVRAHQAAGVCCLMGALGLDGPAARRLLAERPELRAALGLRHVPGVGFFTACTTLLSKGLTKLGEADEDEEAGDHCEDDGDAALAGVGEAATVAAGGGTTP